MLFNISSFTTIFLVTARLGDLHLSRVCYLIAYFLFDVYCFVFIWQQNNNLFFYMNIFIIIYNFTLFWFQFNTLLLRK